ncbi:MAG TPA: Hsp20/alpha crystallin family protein [Nitrospirota bacterium]|nr:Hsp20/alpha crystallin family protein [Nitrospirota bacterium]
MKSITRWDPFNVMRSWDPFDELHEMQRGMDRLFDRFFGKMGRDLKPLEHVAAWTPSIESYMKEGHLVFKAELPGLDPKDLDVSIVDRELVIKGERKSEKGAKEEDYIYREITYGSFERRFLLPEGVKTEELKAKYTNGILEITVPAPAVAKARKIEIEAPKGTKVVEGEVAAKKAA